MFCNAFYFMKNIIILIFLLFPFANAVEFGIHCDGVQLISEMGIENFVNECKEKGYDVILLNVMPWAYYFESETLEALNWEYGGDILSPLLQYAHENGIKVYADIQTLAWKVRDNYECPGEKPSKEDVVNIVKELIDYDIDGISEEMFISDWMPAIYSICQENNVKYIHKHIPFDVAWFNEDGSNAFNAYSNCHVLMTEDYYMNDDLIRWQMAAGFSNGLGKELWIKSCPEDWALGSVTNMENVLAMRIVQYNPSHVFAMLYSREDFENFEPKNVEEIANNFTFYEERPIFNIIVYLSDGKEDADSWQLFDITYPSISNAAEASGYEVFITDEPIENADVYYIYTRGKMNETLFLPSTILNLFNQSKMVFLQVAGELPVEGSWKRVRNVIGINQDSFEVLYGESKIKGRYNGVEYYHLGDEWYLFNSIEEGDVDGEILSEGSFSGVNFVFIVRNKNFVFINGAGLDAEASFPISNIINDALQASCSCVCRTGRISCFYAYDDTVLKIKLPYEGQRVEYMERDMNGNIRTGTFYGKELTHEIKKGSLLIAKIIEENMSVNIIKPRGHLYFNDREIIPMKNTVVVGRITIEINSSNVEYIEIYMNNQLKYKGEENTWLFNEYALGKYEIKVVGYRNGNQCQDAIYAYIFNLT